MDSLMNQIYLNTHYRPVHLPDNYYDHFIKIFGVTDYTCDPVPSEDGIQLSTQICFCSGSNYNGMPPIYTQTTKPKKSESSKKTSQAVYDQQPGDYMYLPYINYTTMEQKCILALTGQAKTSEGINIDLKTAITVG